MVHGQSRHQGYQQERRRDRLMEPEFRARTFAQRQAGLHDQLEHP